MPSWHQKPFIIYATFSKALTTTVHTIQESDNLMNGERLKNALTEVLQTYIFCNISLLHSENLQKYNYEKKTHL